MAASPKLATDRDETQGPEVVYVTGFCARRFAALHNPRHAAYNNCDGYRMPIMLTLILRTALPVLVAGTVSLPLAHADIYTWADASGSVFFVRSERRCA